MPILIKNRFQTNLYLTTSSCFTSTCSNLIGTISNLAASNDELQSPISSGSFSNSTKRDAASFCNIKNI